MLRTVEDNLLILLAMGALARAVPHHVFALVFRAHFPSPSGRIAIRDKPARGGMWEINAKAKRIAAPDGLIIRVATGGQLLRP